MVNRYFVRLVCCMFALLATATATSAQIDNYQYCSASPGQEYIYIKKLARGCCDKFKDWESVRSELKVGRNDNCDPVRIIQGNSDMPDMEYLESEFKAKEVSYGHEDIMFAVRAIGTIGTNGKNHKHHKIYWCHYDAVLQYCVGEWGDWNDVPNVSPLEGHWDNGSEHFNAGTTFYAQGVSVKHRDLWEHIKSNKMYEDNYKEDGYLVIRFRYLFKFVTNGRTMGHNSKNTTFYMHSLEVKVRVHRCDVKGLSPDTTKYPPIGEKNGARTYAVYPDKDFVDVQLKSKVSDSRMSNVVDLVTFNDRENLFGITKDKDPYGDVIAYDDFDLYNKINIGHNGVLQEKEVYEVKRVVNVSNRKCESNTIRLEVVKKPVVGWEESKNEVIECPVKTGVGAITDEEFIMIEGPDIGDLEEYYKPEYIWEYRMGNKEYRKLDKSNYDDNFGDIGNSLSQIVNDEENGKDLRIAKKALQEGIEYRFRPRVNMTAFGSNVSVMPEEGDAYVTVKLAKKLDPKKLKLDIDTNGVKLSRVCVGDYLDEVMFSAAYVDGDDPKEYKLERFSFSYEIDGVSYESEDKVGHLLNNLTADGTVLFRVTMTDGCGNSITAEDSIRVQPLPVFVPENVIRKDGNENVEIQYKESDGVRYVQVMGVIGRECALEISDADGKSHTYHYVKDGQEGRFSPYLKTFFEKDKQIYYAYKRANSADRNRCESSAVRIEVIGREDIAGNRFDGLDTVFVCAGSAVPDIISGTHISLPVMSGGVEYAYRWMYSTDGYSFSAVSNVVGEEIEYMTGPSLKGWNRTLKEGEVLYLKREVSAGYGLSTLEPTVLSRHSSDTVVVTTFSDPRIGLELSGDLSDDGRNYCHGDTVILKGSVSAKFDGEYAEMRRFFNYPKYEVSYYDYVKEEGEYSYVGLSGVDKDGRFVMEGNHNIHAGVTYCGGTVYTEGSSSVSTLGRLDLVPIVGNCVILGDSVSVTAALDGAEVAIVRGDTLAHGNGTATAMLYVDKLAELRYHVLVRDDATGCGARLEKSIPASSVEKRLEPSGIGVEGLSSVGSVCAGSELTIGGKDVYMDGRYASFSWSVDGLAQIGERGRDFVYTFGKTSESYLVERTANYHRGGEFCYSVTDSVRLSTYPGLEEPVIELSDDAVCHGGEVVVKITAKGGGQGGEYKVMFSPGDISAEESVREGDSISHTFGNLTKNEQFYVSLSDAVCSSSMYNRISEIKLVKVDKDLSFSVSTASEIITLEDFKDNAIKIPFNFDGITTGDSMSYRVNGGKEVMFMYDGTALSLTLVDSTDFASGNVHLDFVHYGSVAGCSSEIVGYDITINEGFDGIPNITSAGIEDTIEVCAGTEVEMELSGLDDITFDEKPIEEMTDGVWTWYRNNSPVAGGSANGCVVKAEAGKSKTYYARFSAKDAGGKTRRLWSNPFTVVGKAPIKLEKIKFDNSQSQDFVEFCKGSDAKVTIASSQTFGKEVTLQWQYSENTADWANVPASWNGGVQTVGVKSISVPVSVLGDKTTWFRLSVTDTCGQLAESNLLKVQFKGDVPTPSPVLTSTRIYNSEGDIPVALEFARSMSHSPYLFFGAADDEGKLEASDVGGRQMVGHKDGSNYKWSFGENIVRAVGTALARVSNEVCYSDTVEYKFKLFKKLATPTLSKNPAKDTSFCPGDNNTEKVLTLVDIKGGDSTTYKTYWQYKLNDVWRDVEEGSNMSVFSAEIKDIMKGGQSYYQQLYIYDLNQTVSFRAIVDCEGGYPGTSVVSDIEQTFRVYKPMLEGGIVDGEVIACYGSYPDSIRGLNAILGSGKYTFAWQWSKDDENWEDIPECTGQDFGLFAGESGDKYRLTESTYFRRVVTDAMCGTVSVSQSKHFKVKPEYLMKEEYFSHDWLVPSGNSAKMQGITADPAPVQEYVWYRSPDIVHANSVGSEEVRSEVFRLPLGEESMKVTYYVQGIVNGCPTTNKIGFDILVFNQSGGDIMFGDKDPETSEILACTGDKDIILQSVLAAPNAIYEWHAIVDGTSAPVWSKDDDGKAKAIVRSESLSLDTTTIVMASETEGQKVGFFRISWIGVEDDVVALSSDTLMVRLVPTLRSYSNAYAIFGNSFEGELEIKGHKQNYCLDDEAPEILGGVDSDVLDAWGAFQKKYEPLASISTYYEYSVDGGEWVADEETRRNYPDYVSRYNVGSLERGGLSGDYTVRRVMTDGCSSVMTNELAINLFDDVLDTSSVKTYAFTPEMVKKDVDYAISDGYEIGDSLFIRAAVSTGRFAWFRDEDCTDTLSMGLSASFVLDSALLVDNGAFVYVKAERDGCYGDAVAVPFSYGTRSDGGTIAITDTIVCHNGEYGDIYGGEEPDGWYVSPVYERMAWTYAWQYKWSDSETAKWSDIEDETGEGLPAVVVNSYVKEGSSLHIRRVATNDKGRVRYSNSLRLTRYTPLVPGEVYSEGGTSFCTYDEKPYVKTTSASGGKVWSVYDVEWQYSVNGGEWTSVTVLDSLQLNRLSSELDRSVDNVISVRCLYSDECETVAGEPLEFTFHRHNEMPSITQMNDSCNPSDIKLAVYAEAHPKTYRWSALYNDPNTEETEEEEIWYKDGETCTVVRQGLPTNAFGVKSTDLETGCVSEYFRFNVDSLPRLAQERPVAPMALCPGDDLVVRGGTLSGGNSEKTYRWQFSATGLEDDFSDVAEATGADLLLEARYITSTVHVRRIVSDMCDSDTSESVMVALRDVVSVSAESLRFNDYKCENTTYTVVLESEKDSAYAYEWWTLGSDTIREPGRLYQMVGFMGDSIAFPFVRYLTDSTGLTCRSEALTMYAHNRAKVDSEKNVIASDDLMPCNESYIEISGGSQDDAHITYKWYVNGVEQVGKTSAYLSMRAQDTMRISRIMTNGCESISSNTLVLYGQKVYNHDFGTELSLDVVTDMSDSSVTMYIANSKVFGDRYSFAGDGRMPQVTSNNVILPYDCWKYKDSILDVRYVEFPEYCFRPLQVTPLRGGVISFDGGSDLCGGSDVPAIIVTEVDGGDVDAELTFQWQRRNVYTPDFVNIDGATGKTYVPEATDVETVYRRVVTNGRYRSVSNELTLSIRPLPEAKTPVIGFSDEEMDEMGLKHGDGFYEWFESVETYLVASATEADEILWEKSLDGETWVSLSKGDSLKVSDPTPTVYYRVVASSVCGADTSLSVVMSSRQIAPLTDELTSTTTLFICHEKPDNRGFRTFGLKVIDDEYLYSFRLEADRDIYYVYPTDESYLRCFDGRIVLGHECFGKEGELYEVPQIFIVELFEDADGLTKYRTPACDVTVHVTRHDTATGLSVSRPYLLETNSLRANFTLQVEDGEVIDVREHEGDVAISQGDRVQFHATPTGNKDMSALTYDWVLQEPVNRRNGEEGRRGLDGLTSKLESPSCYYYNGGYYPMKLVVSDGVCTSELLDTTLYIPQSSVRAQYSLPMELAQEDGFVQMAERIEVSPRLFSSYLDILSSDPDNRHEAVLTDEVGRVIWRGDFAGSVRILTDELASAVYMVVVDGVYTWKVVKR